jgi:curli biogenesis system outer membrane secretion channel CsgG
VKGNIYRKGYKEGKLTEQLARFKTGKFAIMPFKGIYENRTIGIATDGNAIADLLSIQMLYYGYNILERDKMNKILEEKAFNLSGLVEEPASEPVALPIETESDWAVESDSMSNQEIDKPAPVVNKPGAQKQSPPLSRQTKPDDMDNMMDIGKMLGVDFIVSGSIIQYQYELSTGGLFGGGGNVVLAVTLTTRIIDIKTGDIIFAMSAGTTGDNLPETLDGITLAITDALKEARVYEWE